MPSKVIPNLKFRSYFIATLILISATSATLFFDSFVYRPVKTEAGFAVFPDSLGGSFVLKGHSYQLDKHTVTWDFVSLNHKLEERDKVTFSLLAGYQPLWHQPTAEGNFIAFANKAEDATKVVFQPTDWATQPIISDFAGRSNADYFGEGNGKLYFIDVVNKRSQLKEVAVKEDRIISQPLGTLPVGVQVINYKIQSGKTAAIYGISQNANSVWELKSYSLPDPEMKLNPKSVYALSKGQRWEQFRLAIHPNNDSWVALTIPMTGEDIFPSTIELLFSNGVKSPIVKTIQFDTLKCFNNHLTEVEAKTANLQREDFRKQGRQWTPQIFYALHDPIQLGNEYVFIADGYERAKTVGMFANGVVHKQTLILVTNKQGKLLNAESFPGGMRSSSTLFRLGEKRLTASGIEIFYLNRKGGAYSVHYEQKKGFNLQEYALPKVLKQGRQLAFTALSPSGKKGLVLSGRETGYVPTVAGDSAVIEPILLRFADVQTITR